MVSDVSYEERADAYAAFLHADLADPNSVMAMAVETLVQVAGPVDGRRVLDLGCGEGHLARRLAEHAAHVTGVDVASSMLNLARDTTQAENVRYLQQDAQQLDFPPDTFDLVVSNLVLMDIPDLAAAFESVRRVLAPGGRFVFSISHPCFQPPVTDIITDEEGRFQSRRVAAYHDEGFWQSHYGGLGSEGAYHRQLSTYLNGLIRAGFAVQHIAEPTLPPGDYESAFEQGRVEIPPVMVIAVE